MYMYWCLSNTVSPLISNLRLCGLGSVILVLGSYVMLTWLNSLDGEHASGPPVKCFCLIYTSTFCMIFWWTWFVLSLINFFHKKQLYALNNCGDDSENNTFWGHSWVTVDTLLVNVLHQTKPHGNSRLEDVTLKHVTLNTAFARTCTFTTFRLIGGLCLNRVHCSSCYLSWFACIANKHGCDWLVVGLQAFYERCRLIYLPRDFHMSWRRSTSHVVCCAIICVCCLQQWTYWLMITGRVHRIFNTR